MSGKCFAFMLGRMDWLVELDTGMACFDGEAIEDLAKNLPHMLNLTTLHIHSSPLPDSVGRPLVVAILRSPRLMQMNVTLVRTPVHDLIQQTLRLSPLARALRLLEMMEETPQGALALGRALSDHVRSLHVGLSNEHLAATALEDQAKAITARVSRLEALSSAVDTRFDAFSANQLSALATLKSNITAFDPSQVGPTVNYLFAFTPHALRMCAALGELKEFLARPPFPTLKESNCAALHTSLLAIVEEFTTALLYYKGRILDPERSMKLVRTAGALIAGLKEIRLVPLPMDPSHLSLTDMAKFFQAQEYNTEVASVFKAATILISLAAKVDACVNAIKDLTPPDVSDCEKLEREAQRTLLNLSLLAKDQKDIHDLVSWLENHPPVPIQSHEELLDKRDELKSRLSRRRVPEADMASIRDSIGQLDQEIATSSAAHAERRAKIERLQRYRSFPAAADVLKTLPLTHPLDNTALSAYVSLFCDRSVTQFQAAEFHTSPRITLLSGIHPDSHVPVILKAYDMRNHSQLCSVSRELAVFSRVHTPNVVRCHGFLVEDNTCYIILERYSCDLAQFVERFPPTTAVKRHIMHEVIEAMVALESCHILHRDIKPQNILVNHEEDGTVTGVALTDFDISKSEEDYIATVRQTQREGAGTIGFIDMEHSIGPNMHFCHLSDVYSMGKVVVWLFTPTLVIYPVPEFATADLSSVEIDMIKTCFGPKSGRVGAYHLLNRGLFSPVLSSPSVSASAAQKYTAILEHQWTALEALKDNAPIVECSVESLTVHFALPPQPSMEGYAQLVLPNQDDADNTPLRSLLADLSRPITVGTETIALFEPLGDTTFPLGPSVSACILMQEAREAGDTETLAAFTVPYACLGRFLAFQMSESPIERGMFGKLVMAGLQANPNKILHDKALVSHLFAATFPQQRRTLLRLLENPVELPFSDIPGCSSDKVLSEDNKTEFAREFEAGYVRLLLEAVVEMRKGFNSLHPEWETRVEALSLEQFLTLSLGFGAFTADEYGACFRVESQQLLTNFTAFVREQMEREDITLLRRLLVFGCGSPILPPQPITLELDVTDARLGLPTAHLCTASISIPSCCLDNLEMAFRDSFDHAGITVGTGDRSADHAVAELDQELNRFRILSRFRRTCPHCGVAVMKDEDHPEDCNHITCHCGKHWCFVCGFVSDEQGPVYGHMMDVHGGFFTGL
ncbi:hypothetical protein KIPB_000611 [Kipferlia bialata]|uniref:Protein kinase domain-containing protein n=1 Tax=Kipferlia bialata TaxID=797122 RepID=A0A9K3GDK8_9EUKA|nr:hypothetical protein KIPB_000611 [Kipferlia bialata]|eukprot:g611.t1